MAANTRLREGWMSRSQKSISRMHGLHEEKEAVCDGPQPAIASRNHRLIVPEVRGLCICVMQRTYGSPLCENNRQQFSRIPILHRRPRDASDFALPANRCFPKTFSWVRCTLKTRRNCAPCGQRMVQNTAKGCFKSQYICFLLFRSLPRVSWGAQNASGPAPK